MKDILRQERGVSLVSLAAVIIVIGIITTMLLYSVTDTNDVSKLTNLYTDIDNLEDRISNYYANYGAIPAIPKERLGGANEAMSALANSPVGANDTGDYLVIDLEALDNLTLNYGRDFENVKNANNIGFYRDLYVINENSHNIFYLGGVRIKEGKTYYTKQDKDTEKVDLRYVDGVKIPDDYTYVSGNRRTGIKIQLASSTSGPTYTWKIVEKYITSINELEDYSNIQTMTEEKKKEFIASVNEYNGYYLQDEGNNIIYNVVNENSAESWSVTYETESIYKDRNGKIAYIPKGFKVSKLSSLNTIDRGLVIKRDDENGRQYVWIEVPEEALKDSEENIATTLQEVKNNVISYVNDYRVSGYEDSYYDGCIGANRLQEYNELESALYASIKEKGGFWIARDEREDQRTASSAYNTVKSETVEGKNKSLIFGIQWDLICKFVENEEANSDGDVLNIKKLFGNSEITIESKSGNSPDFATNNKTILRGTNATQENRKDRTYIDYTVSSYYRDTIF